MTLNLHPDHLDRLASAIAENGIDSVAPAIARLIDAARAAGHHSPALDALASASHPEALRLRAFARLHATLAIAAAGADGAASQSDPPPPTPYSPIETASTQAVRGGESARKPLALAG